MAKRSRKTSKSAPQTISGHAKVMQRKRRRDRVVMGFAGLVVAGFVGLALWYTTLLDARQEDYSIVGKGDPVIVQVHQLNCYDCNLLQANTKRAINQINDDRLHYRIAYLHKQEGIEFASRHGAALQTTLILFDKFGRKQGVYYGVKDVEDLVAQFEALL